MKKCPKTGEPMREIEVDGEKIDISSAGCYFDRGELTRILGNKPSFLTNVKNTILGRPDPLSKVDQSSSIMKAEQDLLKKEVELKNYKLGSPEYDKAYSELKDLQKRLALLS